MVNQNFLKMLCGVADPPPLCGRCKHYYYIKGGTWSIGNLDGSECVSGMQCSCDIKGICNQVLYDVKECSEYIRREIGGKGNS